MKCLHQSGSNNFSCCKNSVPSKVSTLNIEIKCSKLKILRIKLIYFNFRLNCVNKLIIVLAGKAWTEKLCVFGKGKTGKRRFSLFI